MSGSSRVRSRLPIWRIVAVGILAALVLASAVWRWSCSRRIDQAIEAVRAQGFPTSLEELNAWYVKPPPGENAADVLAVAFEYYVEAPPVLAEHLPFEGEVQLPGLTEPLPEDMMAAIAGHLEANSDALELLRQGAAMPECRWPVDFTSGFPVDLLPHLQDLRASARLLALEALYSAEQGNSEKATDALTAAFGVARSLDKEPTLSSQQMGRVEIPWLTYYALRRVVNRTGLTNNQLAQLEQALRKAEEASGYPRGIAGDWCIAEDEMRNARTLQGWPQDLDDVLDAAWVLVLSDRERTEHVAMYQALIAAAQTPLDDRLDALNAVPHSLSPGLSQSTLPYKGGNIMHMIESEVRVGTRLRAARTALAVERYRLAHGELPESLDDLVPEVLDQVPKDPFGDRPLKYRRLSTGYAVYSVGLDKEDDDGLPEPVFLGRYHDLTFRVER